LVEDSSLQLALAHAALFKEVWLRASSLQPGLAQAAIALRDEELFRELFLWKERYRVTGNNRLVFDQNASAGCDGELFRELFLWKERYRVTGNNRLVFDQNASAFSLFFRN